MSQSQTLLTENPSIKILGASGGKLKDKGLTSIQIAPNCVIDAGNIIRGIGSDLFELEHIFLTHTHLDHIVDIPFILDSIFEKQTKPLKIYAQKHNLENLKKYIFNWEIWPDFTTIKIKNSDQFCVELIEIELNHPITIDNYTLTPIQNNHTPSSNGYIVKKENHSILFSSDTYCCDSIWETINSDHSISSVIIEVSFPSKYEELAQNSKHLTPKILDKELKKLKRDDVTVYINHLKPSYEKQLHQEIHDLNLLLNGGSVLQNNDVINF